MSNAAVSEQQYAKKGDTIVTKWGKARVEDVRPLRVYPYVVMFVEGKYDGISSYLTYSEAHPGALAAPEQCTHAWSKYVGFTDTFDYCTKCDEKRRGGSEVKA